MPDTHRAIAYLPAASVAGRTAHHRALLLSDERRVRRRAITLTNGDTVLVDFARVTTLDHGGALELEDGTLIEIIAGEEPLYDIRGRDPHHVMELCWHLGNRHLPTQLDGDADTLRILIKRDHVIADMLKKLGATVTEISEPFTPIEGAYAGHAHADTSHALLNRASD